MRRFYTWASAALLALGAGMATHAAGNPATAAFDGTLPSTPVPETANCDYPFGSGNLVWCVSHEGNLTKLISPSGAVLLPAGATNNEGYGVCYDSYTTYYWSLGWGESGWGPPVQIGLTSTGVTISRTTTDGHFTLLQKFSRDNNERDITIQMKLTNNGPGAANVRLSRFAEVGIDGDAFDDRYDASVDSLWAREVHALTLGARLGIAHTFWIGNQLLASCAPLGAPAVPGGPGQALFSARFDIGTMNVGQSKTVYFTYRAE